MTVLINGGGIGGLTAALALHKQGIAVEVYEQSPVIKELGVGINLLPHAVSVLYELGLQARLDATGVRTKTLIYESSKGQEILRVFQGLDAGYSVPQYSIHRGKLHKFLFEECIERLGADKVHLDRRFVGFEQDENEVRAQFVSQDGTTYTAHGDALVGADGINSVLRDILYPDEGGTYWNGLIMWRGASWTDIFADGRTMVTAGKLEHRLVLYPIYVDPSRPGKALTNWVLCAKRGEPGDPVPDRGDWLNRATAEEITSYVQGRLKITELDILDLVNQTEDRYIYPMCDRDPLSKWTNGRVTLLGDAAHATIPTGSNGAGQAILDAEALARNLKNASSSVEGLKNYESERLPKTRAVVESNRAGKSNEGIIDLVEAKAPDGFEKIEDVIPQEQLIQFIGNYQKTAGFSKEQVGTARK